MRTQPFNTISITATADVVSGRLITANGEYPQSASENAIGVSLTGTSEGQEIPVMCGGIAEVEYTGTAPTKGATVVSSGNDDGKVVVSTTPSTVTVGNACGVALEAGSGGKVVILFTPMAYVGVATEN